MSVLQFLSLVFRPQNITFILNILCLFPKLAKEQTLPEERKRVSQIFVSISYDVS